MATFGEIVAFLCRVGTVGAREAAKVDGMGVTFLETFVRENAHVATRRICLRREPLLSSCGRAPYSCREIE